MATRMRTLQAVVFSAAVLAGCGIAAWLTDWLPSQSGAMTAESQTPANALQVPTSALDFGTVWEQRALEFTVPVQNVSDRPVVVGNLKATCDCTGLSPRSFELQPGQTQIVTGTVDLTRSVSFRSGSEQPVRLHLSGDVAWNARTQPAAVDWILRGRVRRALEVTPAKVHLSGAWEVVRNRNTPTIDILVRPVRPVAALAPEWDRSELHVAFRAPASGLESIYRLTVTPAIDLPIGRFESEIVLRAEFADGTGATDVVIPVEGRVSPPVRIVPALVALQTASLRSQNAPRPVEVAAAQLAGHDGQQWMVGTVFDCPDWLTWSGPSDDGIAGILMLTVTGDVRPGTQHTISVMAVSPDDQAEQLELTVVVAPNGQPDGFSE